MTSLNKSDMEISSEEIHLALLHALPDGLCFTDSRGAIRFWNDTAEAISGFSAAEALCAREAADVFFLSNADGQPINLPGESLNGQSAAIFFLRHKDGHSVPVTIRRLSVTGQNSMPMGTVFIFTASAGVLQPDALGEEIDARPSWLSGEIEAQSLQWLRKVSQPSGILFVRIDDFEMLERRLGPEAAERVVSLVERTATNCLKTDEACSRLSGGSVLASTRSTVHLPDLAERVRALVQSARLHWWGEAIMVTVSIGGTAVGSHDSVDAAVRRAKDYALRASAAGGNQVALVES